MTTIFGMPILSEFTSDRQYLADGGHNWPDMKVVVDPGDTQVQDDEIYLIKIFSHGGPEIKRLQNNGGGYMVHPAMAALSGHKMMTPPEGTLMHAILGGRAIPIQTVEFSDLFAARHIDILGRVVGLWAGKGAIKEEV